MTRNGFQGRHETDGRKQRDAVSTYVLPIGEGYCGGCGRLHKIDDLVETLLCTRCREGLKEERTWG